MEAKGNIRKEVFARRRAATQEEIQEKSRMFNEKITALPEFLDADCFFAYMDFKKEVMTRDLIEKALEMGKTVAVPRVEGDDMVYYEIKDFSTLNLAILVLWSRTAERSARGKRAFCWYPAWPLIRRATESDMEKDFMIRFLAAHPGFTTVAAAFEFQLFDAVPFEETDILPQMLVTEQKIYR